MKKIQTHFVLIFLDFFEINFGFLCVFWISLTHYPIIAPLRGCLKGVKDKVKQARRPQSRPEGPLLRSRAPKAGGALDLSTQSTISEEISVPLGLIISI